MSEMIDFSTMARVLRLWRLVSAVAPVIGANLSRLDFADEATPTQRAAALAKLAGFETLAVEVSKTSIVADGTDESVIASPGLTSFAYTIWVDGVLDSSGTISDGVLELSAATAGRYLVEVRDGDDTGYVEITAE
jgi:hypothetical protein